MALYVRHGSASDRGDAVKTILLPPLDQSQSHADCSLKALTSSSL